MLIHENKLLWTAVREAREFLEGGCVGAGPRGGGGSGPLNLVYWLRSRAPRLGATVAKHFAYEYSKIDARPCGRPYSPSPPRAGDGWTTSPGD